MKEGLLGDTLHSVHRGASSRRPVFMLHAGLDLSRNRLARARRHARRAAGHHPRRRRPARTHDRVRDRRRRALRLATQTRRLRGHGAEGQPVRRPSRTGALSKAGSRTLRWAAVEAAQHAWRPTNPWHQLYTDSPHAPAKTRQVRRRPQDPDRHLARPVPPTALQARRATPAPPCLGKLPLLSGRLTAPHGIEKPRQLPRTLCEDPSAEREMSPTSPPGSTDRRT